MTETQRQRFVRLSYDQKYCLYCDKETEHRQEEKGTFLRVECLECKSTILEK